ncbi:MAG TPA: hypothetical protein VKP61_00975 [Candidatus Acidoferrum sp.]|nr:hypothetical protein [Candidatus Acidoferrum sp.]
MRCTFSIQLTGSLFPAPQFSPWSFIIVLAGRHKNSHDVLDGANFNLPGGYVLRVPVAGWYTWNGECIEGKGVEADVPIENSPESLAAGVDNQLQAALEVVNTLQKATINPE